MNAHEGSGSGDGGPAAQATQAMPASLARRGRTLIDTVEAAIAQPRAAALTERQLADARDIVRRLVDGIEIDLLHFLAPHVPQIPAAWDTIAARGLPVERLARFVLARALERGLEDGPEGREAPDRVPGWAEGDAELAGLWMRYVIADRRRRDSWHAPMIIVSDLPVETQAALIECVASVRVAQHGGGDAQAEIYAQACAQVISLYREETGIGLAAARLIDAALASHSPSSLIEDLVAWAAWPAIIALVARFGGLDQADTTIFLCSAPTDEIAAWLTPTELGEHAVAALCEAIEMTSRSYRDRREDIVVAAPTDAPDDPSPGERIARLAERYRAVRGTPQ